MPFEVAILVTILFTCVMSAIELQFNGVSYGYELGFAESIPPGDWWTDVKASFNVIEVMFTVVFTVELLMRIYVLRCTILRNPLYYIDILAVIIGWLDFVLGSSSLGLDPATARLLRLAKVTRWIRVLRMSQVLEKLHLILMCISNSYSILGWSLVVLFVLMCIMAILVSQIAASIIADDTTAVDSRESLFNYYGTFTRSVITMLEIHFANWAPPCRAVMDHIGQAFGAFLIIYRCAAGFAVLNIINAVFIQQTMKVAEKNHDIKIKAAINKSKETAEELKKVFRLMDDDHDGKVTWTEFQKHLHQESCVAWMETLDINTWDLKQLFDLLDDGDGKITLEEFLEGATKIRGEAKAIDILEILALTKKCHQKLEHA